MPNMRQFPEIPVVGQPLTVLGWTCIVHVKHHCAATGLVDIVVKSTPLGLSADLGLCPSCATPMHVAGITLNPQGQVEFGFQCGLKPEGKVS